jgi:hypothetical protein
MGLTKTVKEKHEKKFKFKQDINQKRFLRKIMWIKEMCLEKKHMDKKTCV